MANGYCPDHRSVGYGPLGQEDKPRAELEKKWPTLGSERTPEEIRRFVGAAWSRLAPQSDADAAERAFLDGQLLGLVLWMLPAEKK